MIRLLYFIPLWLGYLLLVKIPVNAAGLIVTLFTYKYRNTDYEDVPKLFKLWINKEDWQGGIDDTRYSWVTQTESLPQWWVRRAGLGWKSHWMYHAWRNGGDGLRTTRIGGVAVDPEKIRSVVKPYMRWYEPWKLREQGRTSALYLTWQGLKAGLKWVRIDGPNKHTVFKIGYRIEPKYAALTELEVQKDPLLQIRSFATKFLWKHKDQTKAEDYDT